MNIKKILLVAVIVILIIAIPISVMSLQQQQVTTSKATAATSLNFSGIPSVIKPGDKFSVDIKLDPGTNLVSFVSLAITYDKTMITTDTGFTVNQTAFPALIEQPIYPDKTNSCNGNQCTMTITVNIGTDNTKVITKPITIATLGLQAVGSGTTTLAFKVPPTNVRALDPNSSVQQDVLATATPANITITGPTVTAVPSPTPLPSACTTFTAQVINPNKPLVATFSLTATATASALKKTLIDFGDGTTQTLLSNTKNLHLNTTHTYAGSNSYTIVSTLTDATGNTVGAPCTQALTIDASAITSTATDSAIPATGPSDTLLQFGAMGFALMLGGVFLFFFV